VGGQVDELIDTGVLRRLLAFTELKFSNSMIEAWWRSLNHQWLFLHSLDSVMTMQNRVRDQTRCSTIAPCRLERRELASKSPECP
jgi:hypothetical protein